MFYTSRLFLELLHSRQDSIVADPEEATLFFVPLLPVHIGANLWDPRSLLALVARFVSRKYPWWNRTRGADHVFFTTQDLGGCWIPRVLRNSIIISHFGFVGPEQMWTDKHLWARALSTRGAWRGAYADSPLPSCYAPGKDVVVPVYFHVPRTSQPNDAAALDCTPAAVAARDLLLYHAGTIKTTAPWYSQGVRAQFHRLHANTSGVRSRVGSWDASEMRRSTFCLAPSGWGYGWRTYLALSMLCIPVIVQPLVEQAFHDLLNYSTFSLTFDPADLSELPELLRRVPPQRICEMRQAAARYRRLLTWQPPHGLAYDMLMLSLCRRARALQLRYPGLAHLRMNRSWASCARMKPEQLLTRPPDNREADVVRLNDMCSMTYGGFRGPERKGCDFH
jgi:hypothetical protein